MMTILAIIGGITIGFLILKTIGWDNIVDISVGAFWVSVLWIAISLCVFVLIFLGVKLTGSNDDIMKTFYISGGLGVLFVTQMLFDSSSANNTKE